MLQENKVLFYVPVGDESPLYLRICHVIEDLGLESQSEMHRVLDDLVRRFGSPGEHPRIGVFVAAARKDLTQILSIQKLLYNVRILLILPDRHRDTLTQAHTLRPRFITYTDSNPADLIEVLRKARSTHQQASGKAQTVRKEGS